VSVATSQGPSSQPDIGVEPPAISIREVTKTFRLRERYHTLKERALHGFRPSHSEQLRAVDGVTLDVRRGEFFGIVGRNGSGKSTLLKCIAGIYEIDHGELELRGRLSPFIELGVGFNPELTARDNVIINAIMLGLSRKEALARYRSIVEFAELEPFMDVKLKNYSSGMHVRLAFAVAIQVDADILLIDEVLAVGDVSFQQKCFRQFEQLKAAEKTILFVTHDMGAVERFCDRAMLMEQGRPLDIGEASSIARQYNEINFRRIRREATELGGPDTLRSDPVAQIMAARFERPGGAALYETVQGDPTDICMEVYFHADTEDPIFAAALLNEAGKTAFAASTQMSYGKTGHFAAGRTVTVRIRFDNWLAPGEYRLMASVAREGERVDPYDVRQHISSIVVRSSRAAGGAVDLPHQFQIESEEPSLGPGRSS